MLALTFLMKKPSSATHGSSSDSPACVGVVTVNYHFFNKESSQSQKSANKVFPRQERFFHDVSDMIS
ncbi:hypothetical protein MTO96_040235 [Rhipicephalus appendiculatus]